MNAGGYLTIRKVQISNFKLSQNGREVEFVLLSIRAPQRLQKPLFEFETAFFEKFVICYNSRETQWLLRSEAANVTTF